MKRITAATSVLLAFFWGNKPLAPIALYGDSIIALMATSPVVPPFDTAVNMGIVGNAASQVADRIQPIAHTIFLEGGVNSLGGGDPEPILSSYTRSLTKLSGVQVRVIGVLPVDESALPPGHIGILTNAKISAVNAQLCDLCKQFPNCVPVTDLMQMDMTGLTDGGVHPKPEAYKAITTILAKYL